MQVVIVLPYLNEQHTLSDSCRSLGFGVGATATPTSSTLILVDNGSIDDSPQIAERIKEASRGASVITAREAERGIVPARRLCNSIARELARTNGWNERDVLVLQADADAWYESGYMESMRSAAATAGVNVLIEGCLSYPPDFMRTHYKYIEMCRQADSAIEKLFADDADDVVVVDCVSGYRLADYFTWGEHQREFTSGGDEIYSETTRLYLKAKANGAKRLRVGTAVALHSPRKIIQEPALHFATAGFPREASWVKKWRQDYHGPVALTDFYENPSDPDVETAIIIHQQHLVAMFVVLPWLVNLILSECTNTPSNNLLTLARSILPQRTADDIRKAPGQLIDDVFRLIETHGFELLKVSQSAG